MSDPPTDLRRSASERARLAQATRHYGLGLRAQTLLALTAAFVVAFSGLSIVIVQATQKSQALDSRRRASSLLAALTTTLPAGPGDGRTELARERALAALVGHADVLGVRVAVEARGSSARERRTEAHEQLRFGATEGAPTARATLLDGAELSVWLHARGDNERALGRLLQLYSFLTGGLILAVVYVALTRLIVRPVENLTRAVEHARPELLSHDDAIKISGAAEVARLGVAFNALARDLRLEKVALEARLRELEHTTEVLRSTQDQLIRSEKLAGVGRLAAGVAHEIGNPLAAILGLVELLQLGSPSRAEENEFLARIRSETERIHLIIRDLLDYARTQPDQLKQDATADLEKVAEEAVALVAPQKDLRRVTLERRVYAPSLLVRGSAHELTQLVVNLLLNAADAVHGEGHILIELRQDQGFVELALTDSGPGIPLEVRDKLFDPFVTTKPAGQGTGLGLAVCHAIVERLGGSIAGENLPQRGARFVVRLPRA